MVISKIQTLFLLQVGIQQFNIYQKGVFAPMVPWIIHLPVIPKDSVTFSNRNTWGCII